jgi:hypothetical protein
MPKAWARSAKSVRVGLRSPRFTLAPLDPADVGWVLFSSGGQVFLSPTALNPERSYVPPEPAFDSPHFVVKRLRHSIRALHRR